MNSLIQVLSQALRNSRAPLAAGVLVVIAIWIQVSDDISAQWATTDFGTQFVSVSRLLQGIGVGTLAFVAIGVAGSISIRAFQLLLEPPMRRLLSRARVMIDYRRGGLRGFREPKWSQRIFGWVTKEVFAGLAPDYPVETLVDMRHRLSNDVNLKRLALDLEHELRRNPSAPFVVDSRGSWAERLDARQYEDDFRVAVVPALMTLVVSVGLSGWNWLLWWIPLLMVVYCSSLSKRDDTTLLALTWLLDGNGTCQTLEVLRLRAREESYEIRASGQIR